MTETPNDENQSIWTTLLSNGAPFLSLVGLALVASGGFALFLSFSGHFLPHDSRHLGFTAEQLAAIAPNLVEFMFHDRAAFGGVLISLGILYLWLVNYPLKLAQPWAWWALCISGILGFGSFVAYSWYGYLDTWHSLATLFILPIFVFGLWRSKPLDDGRPVGLLPQRLYQRSRQCGLGFALLSFYCVGLILAGACILVIGMTAVFVPEDLQFIELCGAEINDISENLLPVIAHDRAGFGGALLTTGVTIYLILINANWSISLLQSLTLSGLVGFSSAIGIHFYIGYTDFVHLLPAYIGAATFLSGILLALSQSKRNNRPARIRNEPGRASP